MALATAPELIESDIYIVNSATLGKLSPAEPGHMLTQLCDRRTNN
jgi:hypothetical protein